MLSQACGSAVRARLPCVRASVLARVPVSRGGIRGVATLIDGKVIGTTQTGAHWQRRQPGRSGSRGVATIIDGKAIADDVLADVQVGVELLKEEYGEEAGTPTLAVVLVGERPDSQKYVAMKKKAAQRIGFNSVERVLPATCTHDEVLAVVRALNADAATDGILVQLPLPEQCDAAEILEAIDVEKDVDGFHPFNMGKLARQGEVLRHSQRPFVPRESRNISCTPLGATVLLERAGVDVAGKHAVVLGRSNIVGLPMALLLLHLGATVTVCHSRTPDIPAVCRTADVLVAAIGKPEFVQGSWIKPGATVIDVGINFKTDASRKSGVRMCGDVDFKEASKGAGLITPVPGGVGPMTVAMLMANTLNNAKSRLERHAFGAERFAPVFRFSHAEDDEGDAAAPVQQLLRAKSRPISWKFGSSANEPA